MIESNITPGTYEHYKGGRYEVIGIGLTEFEKPVVIYKALYQNELSQLWTRTLESFEEDVAVDGKTVPRFIRIAE